MKSLTSYPPKFLLAFFFSLVFSVSNFVYAEQPSEPTQSININSANAESIAKALKGVGLKKAEAIVDYRERYGEFAKLEELVAVKGIGKGILRKNEHLLSLD